MDTDGNTLLNALIGAVVAVVLSFIPFSPVLGGMTAGYLQGGDTEDGLVVGALSGALASLPLLGVFALFALVLPFFPDPTVAAVGIVLIVIAFVTVLLYGAGFGAIGGALGIYLRDEIENEGDLGL